MDLKNQGKPQKDLSEALIECRNYAERGHKIAVDAVSLLNRVAKNASSKIRDEIDYLESSDFHDNTVINNLRAQLSTMSTNFESLPQHLRRDIDDLSKTSFSITLFGRTMAGKSTLMEILTRGRGDSIGKGAQRTTRDVRSYTYKDLKITDVPGIAAFEGAEDEEVAFEAAKKSDLILFLITDDAPQACEAECMKKILGLGKPVVCLINVKSNLTPSTNLKMFRRDMEKKFEPGRLDAIKRQFFDFGTQYGQDWHGIRFAYVHLKSAFLSQQSELKESRNELYRLSRFSFVEHLIVSEVSKNGSFYKLKAFSDIVVVPVVEALETLFRQSAQNSHQGMLLVGKRKKLKKWTENFKYDGERQINAFLSTLSGELKREVSSFAEDHYDNSNAGAEWTKILKKRNVEQRALEVLKRLGNECEEELREISREINSEIKFSNTVYEDSSINMEKLIDGKRIWNWATSLLSGGLLIGSLLVSGPIGWIGLGVGLLGWLGSFFFDDREKKIRDARRKLEKKLSDYIDKIIKGLRKNMMNVLYEELLKKQLYPMLNTLDEIVHSIFTLSETQQEFAVALNSKLREINMEVIKEALAYLGYSGVEWHISSIARIPGYAMMIVLEDGKRFPNEVSKGLLYLMKEKVWFVFQKEQLKSMLSQAIGRGCDRNSIQIQKIKDIPRIAHIPSLDVVDAGTGNRIRMAQQITELLIMK